MARGKAGEGGSRGVVGATRVGFGVLGVAYGCWGAGRAGQTSLAEARGLPTKTPPSPTVRKVQKGENAPQKDLGGAVEDAHAGLGAGLEQGTQPDGTPHGTTRLRG